MAKYTITVEFTVEAENKPDAEDAVNDAIILNDNIEGYEVTRNVRLWESGAPS